MSSPGGGDKYFKDRCCQLLAEQLWDWRHWRSAVPTVNHSYIGQTRDRERRFYAAHPTCCFRGGGTTVATTDHWLLRRSRAAAAFDEEAFDAVMFKEIELAEARIYIGTLESELRCKGERLCAIDEQLYALSG
ncbi:hypothetical protein PQR66_23830 [Paraburkholderia agricolaris]|uniref:Uncharacterized protein n=1 Tax=Paraburkholderia agricolaris TaxID=2152888 RepID=A0ABW8ZTC4_9BURK